MKITMRATLLFSLILLVAWGTQSQEKQGLNTDNLRDQIRKLESINIDGKSTSIQAIHRRALLSVYRQFQSALQQEIDDLRAQGALLPPGRKRNLVLAKADALEATMKTFSWTTSPELQPPRRDAD